MGDAAGLYLDLLKKCLTASLYDESSWQFVNELSAPGDKSFFVMQRVPIETKARAEGRDWPLFGYTMIGDCRLNNVHRCMEDVVEKGVPGDFMEAGIWRGGTTIFMRAFLKVFGITDRLVWAADSFEGMPKTAVPCIELDLSGFDYLNVPLEAVRENFDRFGLLDDQVRFLKGWFRDTLSMSGIDRLAILRIDGDMYESTRDVLCSLYPRVSKGGYVIVDDYYNDNWKGCRKAVDEYMTGNRLDMDIKRVDWTAAYWRVR